MFFSKLSYLVCIVFGMFINILFKLQIQSANLNPLQRMVEDINDQASDFTANSVALSTQTLSRLEDINTRYILILRQMII